MTKRELAAISSPMGSDYLKTAILLAERAKIVEANPPSNAFEWSTLHRSIVTSSLLSSACALESTINEWFSYSNEVGGRSNIRKDLLTRLWSLGIPRTASFQILQKYQVALAVLGKEEFDEGVEPFQSARLLIDLRNWLVHYEPTWEPVPEQEDKGPYSPHKLTKRLKGKFQANPLCAPHAPYWPYKCLGSGCAIWAAESAYAFMNEFFDRADPKSFSRPSLEVFERARSLGQSAGWHEYGI